MSDFAPTHKITIANGEEVLVSLCDDSGESAYHGGASGPAYTEQEWHTCSNADYERQPDGSWTFLGQAFSGSVESV